MKVAIIGAAGKKGEEYLRALMKRTDLQIVVLVINKKITALITELEKTGVKIIRDGDIDSLLNINFDVAVISVPHSEHHKITLQLLQANKYIVKEKPLALTKEVAEQYNSLVQSQKHPPIFTTVQRDTLPVFLKAKADLIKIGKPKKFTYHYCFNFPTETTGWRAKKATAGGGVLMDMGYHAIDVILKFFLLPQKISANFSYKFASSKQEGLEDRAEIVFEYPELVGQIVLDRHYHEKKECFIIEGTAGSMHISPSGYQIFDLTKKCILRVDCQLSKEEEITAMLNFAIPYELNKEAIGQAFERNLQSVNIITEIYAAKNYDAVMMSKQTDQFKSVAKIGFFAATAKEFSPDHFKLVKKTPDNWQKNSI